MPSAPQWMLKHPCESCGRGYGLCAQGLQHSLMCCKTCSHPTRWQPGPWTVDEIKEMWEGLDMPENVQRYLADQIKLEDLYVLYSEPYPYVDWMIR